MMKPSNTSYMKEI